MFIKMERSKTPMLWFSLFFLVILCSFSIPILAQEVDDERDFDYVKGSKRGPEHWGELRPAWAKCKTGEMQSPIDLLHRRVKLTPKSEEITRFYKPGKAILKNRGHDIEVEWKDESSKIQINGTDYILQQSHWLSPSEHTINGKRYDMEVHIVHQSKDGKIAVIGRLYKIGKPNKFLKKLEKQIKLISDTTLEIDVGIVNPAKIKMRGKRFYRYTGSLTTPPCTEGVIWSVNTQIGTVSKNQVDMLREAVHDHAEKNARPLQRIHGRKVNLYAHMIKNRHD
ncbi:alpha carbonic anhydrase 7-like [Chenopodium quinoa]|uniref:alpha carbonic anhydrase 7-like n=1 Tax=Chenopodium quinoa TaxID=63459 RepID=UPI000B77469E|nr:alpha carbonic anhydrase 7-like [Chenopodium quinoa]